jgi:tRNA modification GTPase
MFSTADTIVAIATPPGRGGIGVVRLSGPEAQAVARQLIAHDGPLEPRRATFTRVSNIDQIVATYFPAPASYTGDDVIELSAHGSPVILHAIVAAAIARGARLAEPGEFTLRAFLNGRIDLMQAEAVADLIDAVTPLQARAAFDQLQGTLTRTIGDVDAALFDLIARLEASVDFPEEGYHFVDARTLATEVDRLIARTSALLADARRGRLVREGLQVAIAGRPNVGKSSVFNALAGASRAIVADMPGTTRDLVTEVVDLDGLRVTLIDTAGLRESDDAVESEGVDRARRAQRVSDLILFVVDRSQPLEPDDSFQTTGNKRLIVANKADLPAAWRSAEAEQVFGLGEVVEVSALTGEGIAMLRERIAMALDVEPLSDRPAITNVRHIALVQRAHEALVRARTAALGDGGSLSEEFVLADLQDARAALEEIAGRRAPDDLLEHIFARFCIGK